LYASDLRILDGGIGMRIIHDNSGVGCGCFALLTWLFVMLGIVAFWAFIYYSFVHFILKFW
jgi:hypothetical protein